MSKFEAGTVTRKTAQEIEDLLRKVVKNHLHINAQSIRPVLEVETPVDGVVPPDMDPSTFGVKILGWEIVHAPPAQRKPRKDKGEPRKKSGSATKSTGGTNQGAA